jgi:hypothetical protein
LRNTWGAGPVNATMFKLKLKMYRWCNFYTSARPGSLMQILRETGIDWRKRRLISNLYVAQSVEVRLNRGETRSVKIRRGVRQGCC